MAGSVWPGLGVGEDWASTRERSNGRYWTTIVWGTEIVITDINSYLSN